MWGWKRLSCQITRAKNSSGRFCARAADSIIMHTDSRRSAPPARAGGGACGAATVPSAGALLSAGAAGAGALVSLSCASVGAAANSISAIIAIRAMRDNDKAGGIVRRNIAARAMVAKRGGGYAIIAALTLLPPQTRCVPLPLVGRGTERGGGVSFNHSGPGVRPRRPPPHPYPPIRLAPPRQGTADARSYAARRQRTAR